MGLTLGVKILEWVLDEVSKTVWIWEEVAEQEETLEWFLIVVLFSLVAIKNVPLLEMLIKPWPKSLCKSLTSHQVNAISFPTAF